MKKQLLSIFAALTIGSVVAQTPSPSWTISQNTNFSITAAGVRFLDVVDANVVWLTGYDGFAANRNYNWFSRTINGGTSYNSGNIFPDTNTFQLGNIEGIDANTAWVSAFKKVTSNQGVIYRTTNGGTTWTNMTPAPMFTATSSFANFVSFLTPSVGIAQGDPVNGEYEIWRTTDGGTSWTPVPGANIPNPAAGEFAIINLYCKEGTSNFWFGTNAGRVYRSTDAGLNWNVSNLVPTGTGTVTEVAFASATHGMAYVVTAGQSFSVFSTTDGGVNWTATNSTNPNIGRNDICGIPGTNNFASVGAGTGNQIISYTTNNGLTWTDWGSTNLQYLCIDFANGFTGWAGSFSNQTNPAQEGIWKYNGVTFNSVFTLPVNICKSASDVTVSPTNNSVGAPPVTFSWSAVPAGVLFSSTTASVPVITFSALGSYTVSLTVTNGTGVSSTSSRVVNILSCGTPTASFNIPATVCNNAAFTFTNTSTGVPVPNISIVTSAGIGATVSAIANNTATIRFALPGVYSITAVASSISGTTSLTQSITVLDCRPTANFALNSSTAACIDPNDLNSTITLTTSNSSTGNTPLAYLWTVTPSVGVTVTNFGAANKTIELTQVGSYTVTLVASNTSGPSVPAVRVYNAILCVTNIDENKNSLNNLNVFPNPAHDQLNILLPTGGDIYKVKLTNVVGSVVYEEKTVKGGKETMSINLTNKAKGIYFLTVESNNGKAIKKIVIE
jgi:photosystem II stability/assembly factor-like uncharacterized protein